MMRGSERIWLSAGGVALAMWLCTGARAQDGAAAATAATQTAAAQSAALPVLHVYADLLQIPVLVLTHGHERLPRPAAAASFSISLQRGPWFRATHVRQEGEDPIALSILLDMSGWTGEVMPKVDAAVASLGMGPLHAQDRVMVYALDCRLSTAQAVQGPDAAALKGAVDGLVAAAANRRASHEAGCGRGAHHLWDTLLGLTAGLANQPGRRVIVALSDGEDGGSEHAWRDVAFAAQEHSVTIFGVTYRPPVADVPHGGAVGGPEMRTPAGMNEEPPFPSLCELSGGVTKTVAAGEMGEPLAWVIQTLRERYIVEFPRPLNATAGRYELTVRVEGSPDDYVRPAGLTFPPRSKAETDDPATIKDETTQRPTVGGRKTMPVAH